MIARCPLLAGCGFDPLLSFAGDAGTHQRAREAGLCRGDDRFHRADAPGSLGAELLSLRHRPGRAASRGRSKKVKEKNNNNTTVQLSLTVSLLQQEALPPIQFDWSSSGLTNPLDGR